MTLIAVNYAVKPIGSLGIVNLILLQSLTQTYRHRQIAWLNGDNIKCLLVMSVVWQGYLLHKYMYQCHMLLAGMF